MSRFDAEPSLTHLAGFQRATVDHVTARFHGSSSAVRRFLVADETGLGKSLVARGVVARTIERLQDDPTVDRIDVVYVCSNADIARQNVKRLDVVGQRHDIATRLTLLARGSRALDGEAVAGDKAVNLVSFTPGTLPGNTWATGTIDERALIHVILSEALDLDDRDDRSSMLILQGAVQRLTTVQNKVWWTQDEASRHGGIEPTISSEFIGRCRSRGLLRQYRRHLAATRGRRSRLPDEVADAAPELISAFRTELARASVHALQPDLIILDEFQRFRELLDQDSGSEAADLAHALFEFPAAKVLLLSATPIKSFTLAEEALTGDDHERDLRKLLGFLSAGSDIDPDEIVGLLADYRRRAIHGLPVADARDAVRERLLHVMCRTERPRVGESGLLAEEDAPIGPVPANDLTAWVGLHNLASAVDAPMGLDYWKSAPYFANFLDGYKFGDQLRQRLTEGPDPAVRAALRHVQLLDPHAVEDRAEIDLGSARVRALAARTVEAGLHQLLWVPPSLPYHALGGPFANVDPITCSKHLIFSAWAATPTAVASLLSYEADRRIGTPASTVTRLDYRAEGGRPGAMTTLALFWPNPALADLCDPLLLVDPAADLEAADVVRRRAAQAIEGRIGATVTARTTSRAVTAESAYWETAIGGFGPLPDALSQDVEQLVAALTGSAEDSTDTDHSTRLRLHVDAALAAPTSPTGDVPPDLIDTVAAVAVHAPGNIAWRSLGRVLRPGHEVTPAGRWRAAAIIASGFRSLFNRAESIGILDQLEAGDVYWRAILTYSAWGDLQAVLDEHLHHLAIAEGLPAALDDELLIELATVVRGSLALRPSTYTAFDPHRPSRRIPFTSRFALRYGTARQSDEAARLPELRAAFNSPFWPWVLATTSVGQEGIDFHWWCSAIIHWNIPANPVDFEQREGRVNRYGGLAIRRNLAHRHRQAVLTERPTNPWEAAYRHGHDERDALGELAPHWVYPGPARIRRTVLPFPLSNDIARYQRLKDDLALYRLTFGQPRQEDLLDILRKNGVQGDPARLAELQLKLDPPRSVTPAGGSR